MSRSKGILGKSLEKIWRLSKLRVFSRDGEIGNLLRSDQTKEIPNRQMGSVSPFLLEGEGAWRLSRQC
jgi:hypothetical protein